MSDLRQMPGYTRPATPPASVGRPTDPPRPEHPSAKADALAVAGEIQASPLVDRLLALYRRAASREHVDKQGRRLPGMTDYEAAAILGVERTSVNAARNQLVDEGRVGKLRRRPCRYRPTGRDVWAWALTSVCEDRNGSHHARRETR